MTSEAAEKYEADRREKLHRLAELGVDPWGGRFAGRQPIAAVRALPLPEADQAGPAVRVAGRVMSARDMGKVMFLDVQDRSGRIQIFIGKRQVGDAAWEIARNIDLGDFVGADGTLGKTRAGELTVFASAIRFLGKCLATPPEKYHGIQNVELRYRQRYLALTHDTAVLQTFLDRSTISAAVRRTLSERGFVEVETPTMQAIPGGAAARPFVTHHNALDLELYLRIAPELYLKRLLVGGMERVFELARVFRNEGIDTRHNPEFTMLEAYQAYGDYTDMMELTESLIVSAVDALGRGRQLPYGEATIDFTPPWPRRTYAELFRAHAGLDLDDGEAVRAAAPRYGIEAEGKHPDVLVNEIFEATVERALDGPVFVIDYPASICPLTKRKRGAERVAERFELFIRGMEVANAYTELNDPDLQEQLFRRQLAGLGADESMARMDEDFLRALKNGMPPAGGLGIGIDRLVMLLTNEQSIRDVILFPLLRPERERRSGSEAEEAVAE